jgi:hypothetical protein
MRRSTARPPGGVSRRPQEALAERGRVIREQRAAAQAAAPAMQRLAEALQGRSGQPYKLRSILYSLWNGKPASLVEIVCLDWDIRKGLCAVLLGFGFGGDRTTPEFFYQALQQAVTAAGQWTWFLEERHNVDLLAAASNPPAAKNEPPTKSVAAPRPPRNIPN